MKESVTSSSKVNGSFTGTEGLVYAALRVWELKHGFGD